MGAWAMLDRILLVALTPLALAGGTATSWLQGEWARSAKALLRYEPAGHVGQPGLTARPATLTIHKGGDGLLHTLVRINGVAVDMVVDTGASRTILSNQDAQRVFKVPAGLPSGSIMTLGGERELRVQSVNSVEMAGRRFTHLDAGLVDGSPVSVIGLDWLALTGPITISAGA